MGNDDERISIFYETVSGGDLEEAMTNESKLKESIKQLFNKKLTGGENKISISALILKQVNSKCIPF